MSLKGQQAPCISNLANSYYRGNNKLTLETKLRQYILENYLFTDDQSALGNDYSFLEQGILDSTGIMELIYFLEDEFGITVADEEMLPENLDSVNNIITFCKKKGTS